MVARQMFEQFRQHQPQVQQVRPGGTPFIFSAQVPRAPTEMSVGTSAFAAPEVRWTQYRSLIVID
jgi:hypothetical protein